NRPQTASKFRHFRALLLFPKQPAQRAPDDPEFCQSGQNHQQNFRKSLSQKYPNSFPQNTKEPPSSSWIGMRARNLVALFYTNTGFPSADASAFRSLFRVGNAICAFVADCGPGTP